MATGENEQGLRKIIDFTRLISVAVLAVHIYLICYSTFNKFGLSSPVTDRILEAVQNIGIFHSSFIAKGSAIILLFISLIGCKGKKDEKIDRRSILLYAILGFFLYFGSPFLYHLNQSSQSFEASYMFSSAIGYILILTSGTRLSRLITLNFFNTVANLVNIWAAAIVVY